MTADIYFYSPDKVPIKEFSSIPITKILECFLNDCFKWKIDFTKVQFRFIFIFKITYLNVFGRYYRYSIKKMRNDSKN